MRRRKSNPIPGQRNHGARRIGLFVPFVSASTVRQFPLAAPAQALAASGDYLAALSPKTGSWQFSSAAEVVRVQPIAEPVRVATASPSATAR